MKRTALRCLLPAVLALAACTTNPATGKKQFNYLNQKDEIAMGVQATPEITKQYGGAVKNQDVQAYVTEIGKKLASTTEKDNPKLPWEFTMLDSDVINAFSLPGGKVFFSRGLAVKLHNEAEMAAVLGHEIGHVTARHINDQMTHQMEVGLASAAAATLLEGKGGAATAEVAPMMIQLGGESVMLRFSRGQETQADSLGMRYMTRAGYNPNGMLGVMQVLQEAMKGNTTPEFFSTHPYPETRIKAISAALQKTYADAVNNPSAVVNEAEYKQRMLRPLSAHARATPASGDVALAASALGDPMMWCEHCRREAAQRAAAQDHPSPGS
jgi:predicted Zn-dependent protease